MLAAITGIFRYATAWRSPTICDFTGSPEAATKSSNPCFDKKRCLLRIMTEFRPKSPTFHSRGGNKEELRKRVQNKGDWHGIHRARTLNKFHSDNPMFALEALLFCV